MSSLHAQLEQYDEMISALQNFNKDAMQIAENLENETKLCLSEMGSDQLSQNSAAKVQDSVKKLRDLVTKSTSIQKALVSEREKIVGLIRLSESMED